MASDRDTLAALLREHAMPAREFEFPADEYECCADAVLAAGWGPPARVFERFEELEEASVGTVIRDKHGDIATAVAADTWEKTGCDLPFNAQFFYFPVEVLWSPTEETSLPESQGGSGDE